jgi:hypothetical protein
MTDAQKYGFYFPAWGKLVRAQNWRMRKGRLVVDEPVFDPTLPELQQVWAYARQIAAREHRGIEPDDFRHACHIVAIQKNKSSADLDNKEVNRVVALFDHLADPDNLAAASKWLHPEIAERAGLIEALKRRAPEAYIRTISASVAGTKEWENLPNSGLKKLYRLLATRKPTWNKPVEQQRREVAKASHQPSTLNSQPFPKLQYIKKGVSTPATMPTTATAVVEADDNSTPF